jgi:isopenicillin-N N-acyltransferase-like protein
MAASYPFVRAGGGPREMGRQIGEQLRAHIPPILEELKVPANYNSLSYQRRAQQVLANLERDAPHLVEEMRGIAEGSGIPFDTILVYNAIAEMWYVRECTAIGFADTPEGVVIGKTNDIGENKAHYHIPHLLAPDGGERLLVFTWPGTVWVNAGVNESGVGIGSASISSAEFEPAGIISNCVYRLALERARDFEQGLEALREVRYMCHPFNVVLGDAAGGLAAVERPVTKMAVRRPENGAAFVTNHWEEPETAPLCNISDQLRGNSKRRFENLRRLVRTVPHTVEGMISVVRDHNPSGGICQHGDANMHSSAGYVVVPSQRRVWFAYGRPCEVEFEPYDL